jgi:hypothetical protein
MTEVIENVKETTLHAAIIIMSKTVRRLPDGTPSEGSKEPSLRLLT